MEKGQPVALSREHIRLVHLHVAPNDVSGAECLRWSDINQNERTALRSVCTRQCTMQPHNTEMEEQGSNGGDDLLWNVCYRARQAGGVHYQSVRLSPFGSLPTLL
ncbi:unnamed protein product [Heligmosomoides polygyrus]|uniref:Uncharacterized protein n=1 Tax=Heligmosomoides polygyrus TaxID=6339 RepID=A0A183F677_HELPZ|nr:unnamed protein product [Heligmosomoides polygyrus]